MYLKNTRKNMKKIFFIFAMMFMPLISALAQESSEFFSLEDNKKLSFPGNNFDVVGTKNSGDYWGLCINNGATITISSKNGERITKVECAIGHGDDEYVVNVNHGGSINVSYDAERDAVIHTINNVNATSLVISSGVYIDPFTEDPFTIFEIEVYYVYDDNTSIQEECILTESFETTTGTEYLGNNVKVTGTGVDANGLSIGGNNNITINPNNGNDVKIFKVELEFSSYSGEEIQGNIGDKEIGDIESSGTSKTISNFYSPNLTISSPNGSGRINKVTVYYVKMSDEKTVTIATTNEFENVLEYSGGCINVKGTNSSGTDGLDIDHHNSVTITSGNGAVISKVELHLTRYYGSWIKSTVGNVEKNSNYSWTIKDINSSSLTISHPGESDGYAVRIDKITVYYKEPVANSTIEVAANLAEGAYWTTFYSSTSNYQAPEGTQVFKVNLEGRKVTMIEIPDGIVNQNEAVVLKSETDNIITMTKTDSESEYNYAGNSLWGTSYKRNNPSPGNVYVLSYKTSAGVAFYKLGSNGVIAANKAYLMANNSSDANAHEFFTFDIETTATGVDNINVQDSEKDVEAKVFDLQGRRVAKPAKGIYIVNGKKILVK